MECKVCKNHFESSNEFAAHFSLHISLKIIPNYACCDRIFSNQSKFKQHLDKFHFNQIGNQNRNNMTENNNDESFNTENIISEPFDLYDNREIAIPNEFKLKLLKTLLSFLCKKSCSRTICFEITRTLISFFRSFLVTLFDNLNINEVINNNQPHFEFFNFLTLNESKLSEHRFLKELDNLNLLVPYDEKIIDKTIKSIYPKIEYVTRSIFLLSPKAMLEKLFANELFTTILFDYIDELNNDSSGSISNIIQTNFWKQKILTFDEGIETLFLPLIIYFDGFEGLNPIGFHAQSYAIEGVYMKLACLPPEFNSLVDFIWPLGFSFSLDTQTLGSHKVYNELIISLNNLFINGVTLKQTSKYKVVKFVVTTIAGDNKGIHKLHDFVCNFSTSKYFCRFCKMNKEEMLNQITECQGKMRSIDNYEHDSNRNAPKETGIHKKSVFCKLKSYHPIENNYVDIMHDILEGVARYSMPLILFNFVKKKFISVDQLNEIVMNFNFYPHKNHIDTISKDQISKGIIKCSAAEMELLILYLNLMIGHLIPKENEFWHLYILLRKIYHLVSSFFYDESTPLIFDQLSGEFRSLYFKLCGNFKYKFHLLMHYPNLMKKFGPLVSFSTMRFESKHKVFKSIIKNSENRKNILKTLALNSQYIYADFLCNFDFSEQKMKMIESRTQLENETVEYNEVIFENNIFYKSIIYRGKLFEKNVVFNVLKNEEHFFGKIVSLLQSNNQIIIQYEKFVNFIGNCHLDCYELISTEKNLDMIAFDDIKDDCNLSRLYYVNQKTFVNFNL